MSVKDILTPERIKQAFEKTVQQYDFSEGQLVLITEEHYAKALTFFDEALLKDEPTCIALGVRMTKTIHAMTMQFMSQNMSLMLVNPDTSEIMAIRVTGISDTQDSHSDEDVEDIPTQTLVTFWKYCDDRAPVVEFFKRHGIKEYIGFFGLGVGPKYRKKGLATQIMEAALCFIKNFEVSPIYIKCAASSKFSAKVFEKVGFELLDEVRYVDYVVDGKQVMCDTGVHTAFKSYALLV